MNAANIRTHTVDTLDQAVIKMMSLKWTLAVNKLPTKKKNAALQLLGRTNSKRQMLENARLSSIAVKLQKHAQALKQGRQDVNARLQQLNRTAAVIKAVNGLLSTVTKVLA